MNGNQLKLKTNNTGSKIGYAKLDFGDGNWTETNGNSITTSHIYQLPGNYEVCLKTASISDSALLLLYFPHYCTDTYCQSILVGDRAATSITGIEDNNRSQTNISVYPNPAQDKVKFYVSKGTDNMTLRIYSSTGELQKEVKDIPNQDFNVEILDLINGIYIYSLSNASGNLSKGKLIVSK